MGPWVGGSLGHFYGGVLRCTSLQGHPGDHACQLDTGDTERESAGSSVSGLSLMFTTGHTLGCTLQNLSRFQPDDPQEKGRGGGGGKGRVK